MSCISIVKMRFNPTCWGRAAAQQRRAGRKITTYLSRLASARLASEGSLAFVLLLPPGASPFFRTESLDTIITMKISTALALLVTSAAAQQRINEIVRLEAHDKPEDYSSPLPHE